MKLAVSVCYLQLERQLVLATVLGLCQELRENIHLEKSHSYSPLRFAGHQEALAKGQIDRLASQVPPQTCNHSVPPL